MKKPNKKPKKPCGGKGKGKKDKEEDEEEDENATKPKKCKDSYGKKTKCNKKCKIQSLIF